MPLNTVYTCGRMHKPRKLKLCNPNANAKAVANAIYKIMLEELGEISRG